LFFVRQILLSSFFFSTKNVDGFIFATLYLIDKLTPTSLSFSPGSQDVTAVSLKIVIQHSWLTQIVHYSLRNQLHQANKYVNLIFVSNSDVIWTKLKLLPRVNECLIKILQLYNMEWKYICISSANNRNSANSSCISIPSLISLLSISIDVFYFIQFSGYIFLLFNFRNVKSCWQNYKLHLYNNNGHLVW
jgi:hypothetical protein